MIVFSSTFLTAVFSLIFGVAVPILSYIVFGLMGLLILLILISMMKQPRLTSNKASAGKVITLNKGYDMPIKGNPSNEVKDVMVSKYAIQPKNFRHIFPIPKLMVQVGDQVMAGDSLLYDKDHPTIKFAAPVSGEVIEINRGAKRSIAEIIIRADKEIRFKQHDPVSLEASREDIVAFMLDAGVWPMLNQRPFDTIPNPDDVPRDIFVSTFDTAPLAPNLNLAVKGYESDFQKGLDVLNKLTTGKVHIGLNAGGKEEPAKGFVDAQGVEKHWFRGFHPAGNVGVHIHHIAPIKSADDKVWTVNVHDVMAIGRLFLKGVFDTKRVIAICGSEIKNPHHVRTYMGPIYQELLEGHVISDGRIISGDVLTGEAEHISEYLNYHDDQVTVIEKGDYHEMFGWFVTLKKQPTVSSTFLTGLFPSDKPLVADTNSHGEKRAFVMTGEYEKMLPMDIYPQHLMKSILTADYEKMEGLGIYELSEEDIALCEFACTSKQPLQKILRQGLDELMEQ